jgi:CHAD domain-containing protein
MHSPLEADESLRKGLRRIARQHLQAALEHVAGATADSSDKAVHEARKAFKKVRAVLRMVRPKIGQSAFRLENESLRDAGRPLSEVRDATILVQTLEKLKAEFAEAIPAETFVPVHEELLAHQDQVRKRVLDKQQSLAGTEAATGGAIERVSEWLDVPNKWSSVAKGVKRVYRQARRRHGEAKADATMEARHEWRKAVKYLRYQLEILRPLWPEGLGELTAQAERLGQLLGEEHDLAVLAGILSDRPERFGGRGSVGAVVAIVESRREDLAREADVLGEQLFQERPKEFARRLRRCGKARRSQPRTDATASAETNAAG